MACLAAKIFSSAVSVRGAALLHEEAAAVTGAGGAALVHSGPAASTGAAPVRTGPDEAVTVDAVNGAPAPLINEHPPPSSKDSPNAPGLSSLLSPSNRGEGNLVAEGVGGGFLSVSFVAAERLDCWWLVQLSKIPASVLSMLELEERRRCPQAMMSSMRTVATAPGFALAFSCQQKKPMDHQQSKSRIVTCFTSYLLQRPRRQTLFSHDKNCALISFAGRRRSRSHALCREHLVRCTYLQHTNPHF